MMYVASATGSQCAFAHLAEQITRTALPGTALLLLVSCKFHQPSPIDQKQLTWSFSADNKMSAQAVSTQVRPSEGDAATGGLASALIVRIRSEFLSVLQD